MFYKIIAKLQWWHRYIKAEVTESLYVRKRIIQKVAFINSLKILVDTLSGETADIINRQIIPAEIQTVITFERIYQTTVLRTIPYKVTLYTLFLVIIRELFTYIMFHVYLLLFCFALYFKHIQISLTYCNYTGGLFEMCTFAGILILIGFSSINTSNLGYAIFLAVAPIKGFIGASVFFKICYGQPILQAILQNHIFTIAIGSPFMPICPIPLKVTPDFTQLLHIFFDIPTIHFFT